MPLHRPCLAPTQSGAACIQPAIDGTELCALHTSDETKRAYMSELGKKSAEARAARQEAMFKINGDRIELRTVEQCQALIERAAHAVMSGQASKGFGTDVKNIVSQARVCIDIKALMKENAELRRLLAIKKSALREEASA